MEVSTASGMFEVVRLLEDQGVGSDMPPSLLAKTDMTGRTDSTCAGSTESGWLGVVWRGVLAPELSSVSRSVAAAGFASWFAICARSNQQKAKQDKIGGVLSAIKKTVCVMRW